MKDDADVTALLLAWSDGDQAAANRLIDAVYDELRRVARRHLRSERDHSLAPTALVHEAYLKLVDQRRVRWQNRAHFFGIAAQLMRRILVDHARFRGAAKRGRDRTVCLDAADAATPPFDVDILALDAALDKLGALDARQSKLASVTRRAPTGIPTGRLHPGGPSYRGIQYDVSLDGQRIYFFDRRPEPAPSEVGVVVGWRWLMK
jgi:RNA polymerase sigma factor (TIGR02999 family)